MLGLCCQFLVSSSNRGYENTGYVNDLTQRVLQLGRYRKNEYSTSHIKELYLDNLKILLKYIPIICSKYSSFRFPSGIFPLFDVVDESLWNNEITRDLLSKIGERVKKHNLRATFHPGQFCSLSSDDEIVRQKSIQEINHHAWIFDMMNLSSSPFYAINVHGGKSNRQEQLISSIESTQLLPSARSRLTLENDESCYSIVQLLPVFQKTGVPLVFDSHHHTFNDGGIPSEIASNAAKETWKDIKPLQHLSNVKEGVGENESFTKRRQHSNMIRYVPQHQLSDLRDDSIDCDIEAKLKNIAIEDMKITYNLK